MNKTKELNKYERISINRIKGLINTRCNGSQKKFAEKTGLNVGSVSQYVNGKNTPSNLNAQKIAEAFDVEPEWVMGFEPKKKTIIITKPNNIPKSVHLVGIKTHGRVRVQTNARITALLTKEEMNIVSLYRSGAYKEIVNLMMEKM